MATRAIDRWATPRVLLVLFVLEVTLLGAVNLGSLPLAVPTMREVTGGHSYIDMCAFCSARTIEAELAAFGAAGRAQQLRFTATVDVLVPLLSAAFGFVALRVLARARWLAWVPIAAALLDYAENACIAALIVQYPAPATGLAALTGALSGAKTVAYASACVLIIAAALARLRRAAPKRV